MSPAAAAVGGDVLVPAPGHVVHAGDVSPVPFGWQSRDVQVLVGSWASHVLLSAEFGGGSVAGVPLDVDDVSLLAVLLGELGVVPLVAGPGVPGHSPAAGRLDTEVVDTSDESEVALLAPVASPGVPDDPVLGAVLLTPPDNADIVVQLLPAGLVDEHTGGVVDEILGDGDGAGDGSSLVDLVHDVELAVHESVLGHTVDLGLLLSPAASVRQAVLALDLSGAAHAVVEAVRLVGRAGLVGDVVPVDPLVGSARVAAVAALVHILAADQHLGGQVHVGPGGLPRDLDSVAQSRRSRERPAGTAINRNMLVPLEGQVVGAVDVAPPVVGGQLSHYITGDRYLCSS